MQKKNILTLKILLICLFLWALMPNPYGYYIILRWLSCAIFAYFALSSFQRKDTAWIWCYGVLAGIYNPIMPTHLGRGIWSLVNIATIGIMIVSFFKDELNKTSKKSQKD
jgi:hypothetical protein